MDERDLLVTPIWIFLVYVIAYLIRPKLTDVVNRRYFFPALTLKIIGAISLGFIYQFYYQGGDTINYHTHGSRELWEIIIDDPYKGFQLLFSNGKFRPGFWAISDKVWFWRDSSAFFVVRIATFFDLLTFSTYSATAVLFAFFSFLGMWLFFLSFYQQFPHLNQWIALASFFIPSTFFWGSGILKDTIALGATGAFMYSIKLLMIDNNVRFTSILIFFISGFLIFSVKKYILLCFLPAAIMWVYLSNLKKVRSIGARILLIPLVFVVIIGCGYWAVNKIGETDKRYELSRIPQTARTTAYDIAYWTGKNAGSTYSLGELDGTFSGMFVKAPQAINVSLFRPYLWETKSPLMLMSALESFFLLLFTCYVFIKQRSSLSKMFLEPNLIFSLVFCLTFSFAVGISSYNFGTLSRYRIPMLPFYVVVLGLMFNYTNKEMNFEEFEETE